MVEEVLLQGRNPWCSNLFPAYKRIGGQREDLEVNMAQTALGLVKTRAQLRDAGAPEVGVWLNLFSQKSRS